MTAALLLAACGANDKSSSQSQAGGDAKAGGTLYMLTDAARVEMDPAKSRTSRSRRCRWCTAG